MFCTSQPVAVGRRLHGRRGLKCEAFACGGVLDDVAAFTGGVD